MLMNAGRAKENLIGKILLDEGIIDSVQLEKSLLVQEDSGGFICSIIIRLGFARAQDVFSALSRQIGVRYVDLGKEKVDTEAAAKVPARLALHYKMMPCRMEDNSLLVVLADPLDIHNLDELQLLLGIAIKPALGYEPEILDNIQKYYGVGAETLEAIMAKPGMEEKIRIHSSTIEDLEGAVEDASIIKFVNQLLSQSVEETATDIHLEPFEDELRVRFRIDGFLYEVPIAESIKHFHRSLVSRIKVMAAMDIAEHRLPQDGRIKIKVKGEELDLRVSVIPSAYGESVQVRILSKASFLALENLGLCGEDSEKIGCLINRPYGIVFSTGPTGSGKSTTLYACLSKKNNPANKIVTIEDPIEYQLRGITQMQINPRIKFTFAEGLRSVLRHDPDIIMVGEVRDADTAEITIRSAMTGHLVFSTLHTNDAASAPVRLIDMGVEPFLAASSLEGIIAQRLVRLVCPSCKNLVSVDSAVFAGEGVDAGAGKVNVYEGKGCEKCRFTGYQGRTAIFEILSVTQDIRDLIFRRASSQEIKVKALSGGMRTLRQDGLRKALKGITTLPEVMRVT